MPDLLSISVLTFVGVVAGFINVNAGGGSTLTLPALIFLGLDSSVANGTNRVAILLQNISAVQSFKQEKLFDLKTSLKLSFFTLPGSIMGALLAVRLEDKLFQIILGIIMIGIVISMIIPKKKTNYKDEQNNPATGIYLSMIGIGFYGGFIQVGVGFLLMASLQFLMKLDLIRVNMYKVFIVLIYTVPALLIFTLTDNVNWILGLFLAIGNTIGGWWGAKLQIKKGEKLIQFVLVIAVFIMAIKLLDII